MLIDRYKKKEEGESIKTLPKERKTAILDQK